MFHLFTYHTLFNTRHLRNKTMFLLFSDNNNFYQLCLSFIVWLENWDKEKCFLEPVMSVMMSLLKLQMCDPVSTGQYWGQFCFKSKSQTPTQHRVRVCEGFGCLGDHHRLWSDCEMWEITWTSMTCWLSWRTAAGHIRWCSLALNLRSWPLTRSGSFTHGFRQITFLQGIIMGWAVIFDNGMLQQHKWSVCCLSLFP